MPTQRTVRVGECMSSLSSDRRFRSHKTVYEDPANAELRARRPVPCELHPGDVVVLPDPETRVEDAPTTARTTFQARRLERTFLRLRVRYRVPLAYRLVTDRETLEGVTNGASDIVAEVARDARSASILLWVDGQSVHPDDGGPAVRRAIDLGCLAPIDTLRGVQGRLRNLGFGRLALATDPEAECDPETAQAIRAFQSVQGLPETGKPEDVRAALAAAHDG